MIYLSMDCEGIATQSIKGPKTVEESQNSIKNFARIAENNKIFAEFFVTPAAAKMHPELFKKLKQRGHLISLHLHLSAYSKLYRGQKIELANLSYEKQKPVIESAISDFFTSLEFAPDGFRPGMASANLDTIEILTANNIHRGSVSIPGYVNPKYKIDWSNWPDFPHDITTANGQFHNLPLRENMWIDNTRISKSLEKLIDRDECFEYIAIYSHNWVNFEKKQLPSSFLINIMSKDR